MLAGRLQSSFGMRIWGCLLFLGGCVEREAADPGEFVREEIVNRVTPPSRATSRTVRCACDADGALHISAPQGSDVSVPEDAVHPSEAQIVLPEDQPRGVRLRQTKSLGFIGDNKLSGGVSRGGPWNVPDALLPPHVHREHQYRFTPPVVFVPPGVVQSPMPWR
jgi:hypothetical protein